MSEQVLSNDVENLTTSAPATSMSKQEADKTVVKGIAQKYEVAIKVKEYRLIGGTSALPPS
jgi:hypothetical protein